MNANLQRWRVILAAVGVLITFLGMMLITVTIASMPHNAPVELVRKDYNPPAIVCPGDVIPFVLEWKVNRAATLTLTPTHNRGHDGAGGNVVIAHYDDISRVNQPETGSVVDADLAFVVPDLSPGEYARILSVGTASESSLPFFVTLPYTIGTNCE